MMGKAYLPDMSLRGKVRRRIVRFVARLSLPDFKGKYVSFTFDDFPVSAALNGARILEKNGIRGTFYTSTGQMGQASHTGQISGPAEIHALRGMGHEIACHTENHVDCASTDPTLVDDEVRRNCEAIMQLGAPDPTSFAYPYGDVGAGSKRVLAKRFDTMRGVQAGINRPGGDAHQLYSVGLESRINPVARAKEYLDELSRGAGWLIFFTHDVRDRPSDWGCTPGDFAQIVDMTRKRGFTIGNVQEIHHHILAEDGA